MKNRTIHIISGVLFLLALLNSIQTRSQEKMPADIKDVIYTIENDVQISPTELQFDLYLKDTDPAQIFRVSLVQGGFFVSTAIVGGGTITCNVVHGYSELSPKQQPDTACYQALDQDHFLLKMAANPWDSICENNTIISTTGLGTRVGRLSIVNTVPFPSGSQANITFCHQRTLPYYAAKVFEFLSCVPLNSVEVPLNDTNSFQGPTYMNRPLNGPSGITSITGNRIKVYSSGKTIFLENQAAFSNDQVAVLNLLGQQIISLHLDGTSTSARIESALPAGYYLVKITNNQDVTTQKIYIR